MSQRVWLVGVMTVALGVVGITAEPSSSQEASQEQEGSQPQAEASGEFGRGFGRVRGGGGDFGGGRGEFGRGGEFSDRGEFRGGGAFGRGEEFGAGMAADAPAPQPLPAPAVPRIWVTEDPESTEKLYEILKSPLPSAGLVFPDGTALEEIIAYLSEEYEVEILLDTVALDELGIGADEPVSISVRNIQLGQAMRRMLQPLELTCIINDGLLMVTSEEEALAQLDVAVYDVRDLLLEADYDSLIELVTSTIDSDTWAENGGGEAEIVPFPQRGALIVSQGTTTHRKLLALFEAMRNTSIDPSAKPLPEPASVSAARRAGPHCVFGPTPAERVDSSNRSPSTGGGGGGGFGFGYGSGAFATEDAPGTP